jgi:hypothetical protein
MRSRPEHLGPACICPRSRRREEVSAGSQSEVKKRRSLALEADALSAVNPKEQQGDDDHACGAGSMGCRFVSPRLDQLQ